MGEGNEVLFGGSIDMCCMGNMLWLDVERPQLVGRGITFAGEDSYVVTGYGNGIVCEVGLAAMIAELTDRKEGSAAEGRELVAPQRIRREVVEGEMTFMG